MLVLTRKMGEGIAIGDQIRVTLISIKGNQVKLGVEAPADTKVYREELYASIVAENAKAAALSRQNVAALQAFWQQQGTTRRK